MKVYHIIYFPFAVLILLWLTVTACDIKPKHMEIRNYCVVDSISVEPSSNTSDPRPVWALHTTCNTTFRTVQGSKFGIGDTVLYIYRK